jgi:predicted metal-dependent hydrolase
VTTNTLQLGSVEALIVRKLVKNLHLSVLPPYGRVRVTAPEGMHDNAIRTMLATKLPWIKKQQEKFKSQDRQTKREYVSGESHYFFGKRYRLEVVYKEAVPVVSLKGKTKIVLQVRPNSSVEKRSDVMMEWYRSELHPLADKLMVEWQKKIKVQVESWGIMRMKTRWGTCNHKKARILLNLELAKKPLTCLEYVIVHELLHVIEKKHNENFVNMLTKYIPKWRSVKEELNRLMLSHEEWDA